MVERLHCGFVVTTVIGIGDPVGPLVGAPLGELVGGVVVLGVGSGVGHSVVEEVETASSGVVVGDPVGSSDVLDVGHLFVGDGDGDIVGHIVGSTLGITVGTLVGSDGMLGIVKCVGR